MQLCLSVLIFALLTPPLGARFKLAIPNTLNMAISMAKTLGIVRPKVSQNLLLYDVYPIV